MSFPETPKWYPEETEPLPYEFTVDGVTHSVPRQNTRIRRFEQGEGKFDYLVHTAGKGQLIFMPSDEGGLRLFEDMENDGFKVEVLPEVDEEAMKVIIGMQINDINGFAA